MSEELVKALLEVARREVANRKYSISEARLSAIALPLIQKGVAQLESSKISKDEALSVGTEGVKRAVGWILQELPSDKALDEKTAAYLIHKNFKALTPNEKVSLKGFYPTPQYEV